MVSVSVSHFVVGYETILSTAAARKIDLKNYFLHVGDGGV
jgi:hypothetical protein